MANKRKVLPLSRFVNVLLNIQLNKLWRISHEVGIMSIAQRILQRRQQLGMSRLDLGLSVGIDQKQIWRYETGKNDPTGTMIIELAHALDTSTDWLLGVTDEIKPITGKSDLTAIEREMINIMRSKSPEGQRKLVDVAKVM